MGITKEKYIAEIRTEFGKRKLETVHQGDTLLENFNINGKNYQSYSSTKIIDCAWDDFVTSVNDSSVHQLSGWVDAKKLEGWDFLRIVYYCENNIVGGYQLLIKKLPLLGKVAYLNQGPVVKDSNQDFIEKLLSDFEKITILNKISLVVISPPLSPSILINTIEKRYLRNEVFDIINAEAEIDISQDEKILIKNLLRMRRQNIGKGKSYEFKVEKGDEKDLKIFFELMSETSKRNHVKPNPPSLLSVKKIWDYYYNKGLMNIYKFYIKDELISSIITFEYQDTFTPWKFGWTGKKRSYKPNDVFHWELLKIAKAMGFKKYNLGGINLSHAEKYIKRQLPFTKRELKSSTFFKMGFGCYIKKLPYSKIYIPNPILKIFYQIYVLLIKRKASIRRLIN